MHERFFTKAMQSGSMACKRAIIGARSLAYNRESALCRDESGAFPLFGLGPLPYEPLGVAIKGKTSPHHCCAHLDIAVPLWPRINTPPINGLMAFSSNATFIDSCPTMAVNGNTARVRMIVLRGVAWYPHPLPFEPVLSSALLARALCMRYTGSSVQQRDCNIG